MIYDVTVNYQMNETLPIEADDEADAAFTAKEMIKESYNTVINDIDIIDIKVAE